MSFAAPWFLLLLLAIPVLIAGYVLVDRRRREAAARFASPQLLPSVAPRRPGFRRHAPMVLYAAALTIAAIALARPEATVAVPEERASVVLVTDISGSMEARDVEPARIEAVRDAALDFLDRAPDRLRSVTKRGPCSSGCARAAGRRPARRSRPRSACWSAARGGSGRPAR